MPKTKLPQNWQEDPDKIKKIFEELKVRGLINKKIKLSSRRRYLLFFPLDFKASILKDEILYNPSLSKLKEDTIKFALLHEAGHLDRKFNQILLVISLLISFGVIWIIYNKYTLLINTILIYIFSLGFILLLVWIIFFKPLFRKEELKADKWAINKINKIKKFKKRNLKTNLKGIFADFYKKSKPSWIPSFIFPHPSLQERIENMVKNLRE